eukprot:TRINITY_DN2573_c0_g2_i2.p1 TRINITY_DN2573_c0_g2~~TRINITY_DN2573_c0_g2_i2.p1  ORF type:complete len:333 (-),score=62.43 TRINITY_DN2573_c0_g2_i2:740-1738(-)
MVKTRSSRKRKASKSNKRNKKRKVSDVSAKRIKFENNKDGFDQRIDARRKLEKCTVRVLKASLKELNMKVTGSKPILVNRLLAHQFDDPVAEVKPKRRLSQTEAKNEYPLLYGDGEVFIPRNFGGAYRFQSSPSSVIRCRDCREKIGLREMRYGKLGSRWSKGFFLHLTCSFDTCPQSSVFLHTCIGFNELPEETKKYLVETKVTKALDSLCKKSENLEGEDMDVELDNEMHVPSLVDMCAKVVVNENIDFMNCNLPDITKDIVLDYKYIQLQKELIVKAPTVPELEKIFDDASIPIPTKGKNKLAHAAILAQLFYNADRFPLPEVYTKYLP